MSKSVRMNNEQRGNLKFRVSEATKELREQVYKYEGIDQEPPAVRAARKLLNEYGDRKRKQQGARWAVISPLIAEAHRLIVWGTREEACGAVEKLEAARGAPPSRRARR